MKDWKRRIRVAWEVLIGKKHLLTDARTQVVYVQSAGPEGKLVQLVPWRDQVLALDNSGSIWLMDFGYGSLDVRIQFLMESPRRRI